MEFYIPSKPTDLEERDQEDEGKEKIKVKSPIDVSSLDITEASALAEGASCNSEDISGGVCGCRE